jgi:competence protein ComGF
MAQKQGGELVSAKLLGSHKVDILVKGTQIPSTLLYTIQDVMQCITEKQILLKVQCSGEQESQQGC